MAFRGDFGGKRAVLQGMTVDDIQLHRLPSPDDDLDILEGASKPHAPSRRSARAKKASSETNSDQLTSKKIPPGSSSKKADDEPVILATSRGQAQGGIPPSTGVQPAVAGMRPGPKLKLKLGSSVDLPAASEPAVLQHQQLRMDAHAQAAISSTAAGGAQGPRERAVGRMGGVATASHISGTSGASKGGRSALSAGTHATVRSGNSADIQQLTVRVVMAQPPGKAPGKTPGKTPGKGSGKVSSSQDGEDDDADDDDDEEEYDEDEDEDDEDEDDLFDDIRSSDFVSDESGLEDEDMGDEGEGAGAGAGVAEDISPPYHLSSAGSGAHPESQTGLGSTLLESAAGSSVDIRPADLDVAPVTRRELRGLIDDAARPLQDLLDLDWLEGGNSFGLGLGAGEGSSMTIGLGSTDFGGPASPTRSLGGRSFGARSFGGRSFGVGSMRLRMPSSTRPQSSPDAAGLGPGQGVGVGRGSLEDDPGASVGLSAGTAAVVGTVSPMRSHQHRLPTDGGMRSSGAPVIGGTAFPVPLSYPAASAEWDWMAGTVPGAGTGPLVMGSSVGAGIGFGNESNPPLSPPRASSWNKGQGKGKGKGQGHVKRTKHAAAAVSEPGQEAISAPRLVPVEGQPGSYLLVGWPGLTEPPRIVMNAGFSDGPSAGMDIVNEAAAEGGGGVQVADSAQQSKAILQMPLKRKRRKDSEYSAGMDCGTTEGKGGGVSAELSMPLPPSKSGTDRAMKRRMAQLRTAAARLGMQLTFYGDEGREKEEDVQTAGNSVRKGTDGQSGGQSGKGKGSIIQRAPVDAQPQTQAQAQAKAQGEATQEGEAEAAAGLLVAYNAEGPGGGAGAGVEDIQARECVEESEAARARLRHERVQRLVIARHANTSRASQRIVEAAAAGKTLRGRVMPGRIGVVEEELSTVTYASAVGAIGQMLEEGPWLLQGSGNRGVEEGGMYDVNRSHGSLCLALELSRVDSSGSDGAGGVGGGGAKAALSAILLSNASSPHMGSRAQGQVADEGRLCRVVPCWERPAWAHVLHARLPSVLRLSPFGLAWDTAKTARVAPVADAASSKPRSASSAIISSSSSAAAAEMLEDGGSDAGPCCGVYPNIHEALSVLHPSPCRLITPPSMPVSPAHYAYFTRIQYTALLAQVQQLTGMLLTSLVFAANPEPGIGNPQAASRLVTMLLELLALRQAAEQLRAKDTGVTGGAPTDMSGVEGGGMDDDALDGLPTAHLAALKGNDEVGGATTPPAAPSFMYMPVPAVPVPPPSIRNGRVTRLALATAEKAHMQYGPWALASVQTDEAALLPPSVFQAPLLADCRTGRILASVLQWQALYGRLHAQAAPTTTTFKAGMGVGSSSRPGQGEGEGGDAAGVGSKRKRPDSPPGKPHMGPAGVITRHRRQRKPPSTLDWADSEELDRVIRSSDRNSDVIIAGGDGEGEGVHVEEESEVAQRDLAGELSLGFGFGAPTVDFDGATHGGGRGGRAIGEHSILGLGGLELGLQDALRPLSEPYADAVRKRSSAMEAGVGVRPGFPSPPRASARTTASTTRPGFPAPHLPAGSPVDPAPAPVPVPTGSQYSFTFGSPSRQPGAAGPSSFGSPGSSSVKVGAGNGGRVARPLRGRDLGIVPGLGLGQAEHTHTPSIECSLPGMEGISLHGMGVNSMASDGVADSRLEHGNGRVASERGVQWTDVDADGCSIGFGLGTSHSMAPPPTPVSAGGGGTAAQRGTSVLREGSASMSSHSLAPNAFPPASLALPADFAEQDFSLLSELFRFYNAEGLMVSQGVGHTGPGAAAKQSPGFPMPADAVDPDPDVGISNPDPEMRGGSVNARASHGGQPASAAALDPVRKAHMLQVLSFTPPALSMQITQFALECSVPSTLALPADRAAGSGSSLTPMASYQQGFTPEEDMLLCLGMLRYGTRDWSTVRVRLLPTKSESQLVRRLTNLGARRKARGAGGPAPVSADLIASIRAAVGGPSREGLGLVEDVLLGSDLTAPQQAAAMLELVRACGASSLALEAEHIVARSFALDFCPAERALLQSGVAAYGVSNRSFAFMSVALMPHRGPEVLRTLFAMYLLPREMEQRLGPVGLFPSPADGSVLAEPRGEVSPADSSLLTRNLFPELSLKPGEGAYRGPQKPHMPPLPSSSSPLTLPSYHCMLLGGMPASTDPDGATGTDGPLDVVPVQPYFPLQPAPCRSFVFGTHTAPDELVDAGPPRAGLDAAMASLLSHAGLSLTEPPRALPGGGGGTMRKSGKGRLRPGKRAGRGADGGVVWPSRVHWQDEGEGAGDSGTADSLSYLHGGLAAGMGVAEGEGERLLTSLLVAGRLEGAEGQA